MRWGRATRPAASRSPFPAAAGGDELTSERRTSRHRLTDIGVPSDLVAINRWLSLTRFRSAGAVTIFALLLYYFDVGNLSIVPLLGVTSSLFLFSVIALNSRRLAESPQLLFHLQNLVDLSAITVGIGVSVEGLTALVFRMIYVLVIVPASFVSVRAGLLVTATAMAGHVILFALERGMSLAALVTPEFFSPPFLFLLVAHQSFFYGGHLEAKNTALARLATRLEDSRARSLALVDLARTLNSTLEAPELLARMNQAALGQLSADWAATFLVNSTRGTFRLAALSDLDIEGTELARAEFPLDGWPAVDRLSRERVIVITGSDAVSTSPLLTGGRDLTTIFLAGLHRDHHLVGILALGYSPPTAPARAVALQQLSDIAEHATIALGNAQLLDEARQASALKSEFVSTVSHELRTPLNVIIGYTQMLREGAAGPLNGAQRDLFDRLDARSRELLELIEATLHVGRLETGRHAVILSSVSLTALIQALEASTSGLPCSPAVELRWQVPIGPAGVILTDCGKITLIVRNLVSNALKFTTYGSVTIALTPRGEELVIEVIDTGIGIDAQHVPIIFDMFRQVDTTSTRRHSGVGLGLYIVRQFVDRLSGTVEVHSVPGSGSTFRVTLPGYRSDPSADLTAGAAIASAA